MAGHYNCIVNFKMSKLYFLQLIYYMIIHIYLYCFLLYNLLWFILRLFSDKENIHQYEIYFFSFWSQLQFSLRKIHKFPIIFLPSLATALKKLLFLRNVPKKIWSNNHPKASKVIRLSSCLKAVSKLVYSALSNHALANIGQLYYVSKILKKSH